MRYLALLLLAAAACIPPQPAASRGLPELGVEFSWTGVQPCTNISPRIVVHDVPPAAKRLRVELVDLDSAFTRHGGGEVEAPRDGVIPVGALTSYRGPCPSQQPIMYEMRVEALDGAGRVIARGAEKVPFTPISLRRGGQRRN